MIGKRQIVLATLVVALGVAVYLNWQFAKTSNFADTTSVVETEKNLGDSQYVNKNTSSSAASVDSTASMSSEDAAAAAKADEYFSKAKVARQQAYDESKEAIQAVIDNKNATDDIKKEAVAASTKMADNISQENDIENLVVAKGFKECLATIKGDKIDIAVRCDALTESQGLQIKEIIMKQTEIPYNNITITEVK